MSDKAFSGKIVVTGGAGFIGSALVWGLNQKGLDNILIVDRLRSTEKWRNLLPLRFDDYAEVDSFRSRVAHARGLHDVTCVFHMGACSSTTELNCSYLMDNNYAYTQELAAWALPHSIRFLYASSAATYGDGMTGYSEETPLESLRPLNPYGYSKHAFDVHARRRGWLEHAVGLKFFNVFGPNEAHKENMRSVVCKAFDEIKATGKVSLFRSHRPDYEDGEQERDFLYIKDAVNMTLHLATLKVGGLINIGSGHAATWLDLIRPVFDAMGREENIEFVDMPESLRERYQYYTCADLATLWRTGYQIPQWGLNAAVHDYVQRYLMPDLRLGDAGTSSPKEPAVGPPG